MSLYWFADGKDADGMRKALEGADRKALESLLFNRHYNDFCREHCDKGDEKRIPYMGWFWREVDFFAKRVPMGFSGNFVGFMENNKWDHDERNLTEAEYVECMRLLDAAIAESRKGGNMADICAATDAAVARLAEWITSLTVNPTAPAH